MGLNCFLPLLLEGVPAASRAASSASKSAGSKLISDRVILPLSITAGSLLVVCWSTSSACKTNDFVFLHSLARAELTPSSSYRNGLRFRVSNEQLRGGRQRPLQVDGLRVHGRRHGAAARSARTAGGPATLRGRRRRVRSGPWLASFAARAHFHIHDLKKHNTQFQT